MLSDGKGRPLDFFLSPGQMADSRGALVLLRHLPPARRFLGDKAYDADWLREETQGSWHPSLHPAQKETQETGQIQRAALSQTLPHRECLRSSEGLARHRDPL